ncbi:hypothetical protein BGZ46_008343 [Entomortierella lignicola]|nr:hypothetical protein BGZ46_008343 [Entomortierella lignicola]
MYKLLTLCPSLRILDTALRRSDDYILGQFPVRELLKEPWVCTKLEVFRVVIEKVVGGYTIGEDGNENEVDEYADQDVYAYLSPYSDEEYTRRRKQEELENQERRRRRDRVRANMVPYDCHREFYTQISKLMRLEELNVGFGRWSGRHCESAPKFSIESGLELLEGLKQLRILNVANTKNDIQRQELEWMCEHWPNLESIEGLYRPKVASWWSLEGASSIPAKVENVLM